MYEERKLNESRFNELEISLLKFTQVLFGYQNLARTVYTFSFLSSYI